MAPGTPRFPGSEGSMRRRSLLLLALATAISSLALINILKLCLNSAGIVLGSGKSSSCGRSTGGGAGFLILSMIGPSLRSTTYGNVSALEGLSSSLGSWGPRALVVVSDVFVVGGECSYEIVTRIELKVMMTKSSSNRCSLFG